MTAVAAPKTWDQPSWSRSAFGKSRLGNAGRSRPRLGLALSGGGAKAVAHVGVLRAFQKAGLTFDLVSGTSGGALAGVFYCDGQTPDEMIEAFRSEFLGSAWTNWIPWLRYWRLSRLLKRGGLRDVMERRVRSRQFRDLRTPFFTTSTDLQHGEAVIHDAGPLIPAVLASMALPGFSPPMRDGDRLLIDGGVLNYLPAQVLRQKRADLIVGVDLGGFNAPESEWKKWTASDGALRVLRRAWQIQNREIMRDQLAEVDVLVRPRVEEYSLADFGQIDALVAAGEEAGMLAAHRIRKLVADWKPARPALDATKHAPIAALPV